MGSWKTLSVLMLGQWNFVGTLIGHYLEDLGGKNCYISVSHLLTCLLYAILKLLQEEGQTHLPYRLPASNLHEPSLDTIIKIQGEPNCLYVSQSVSWLMSLLKLGQYRQIVGKLSQF